MYRLDKIIEKCKNGGLEAWDVLAERYSGKAVTRRSNILNEAEYDFLINFDDDKLLEETVIDVYYDSYSDSELPPKNIIDAIKQSETLQNQPAWRLGVFLIDGIKEYELDKAIVDWLNENKENIIKLVIYCIMHGE